MLTPVPPTECMTAREAVSVRLDEPLPELDQARLDEHLRGCAECHSYALDVAAITGRVRSAPLQAPLTPAFSARSRIPVVRLQAAAAAVALIAVATGSSFFLGRTLGGHGPAPRSVTGPAEILTLQADTTNQHLLAMLRKLGPNATLNTGKAIAL